MGGDKKGGNNHLEEREIREFVIRIDRGQTDVVRKEKREYKGTRGEREYEMKNRSEGWMD